MQRSTPKDIRSDLSFTRVSKYIVVNVLIVLVLGYLTIDSQANGNSRLAAIIISVLLPYTVFRSTEEWSRKRRFFIYGTGVCVYLFVGTMKAGLYHMWFSVFIPTCLSYLVFLYLADRVFKGLK